MDQVLDQAAAQVLVVDLVLEVAQELEVVPVLVAAAEDLEAELEVAVDQELDLVEQVAELDLVQVLEVDQAVEIVTREYRRLAALAA